MVGCGTLQIEMHHKDACTLMLASKATSPSVQAPGCKPSHHAESPRCSRQHATRNIQLHPCEFFAAPARTVWRLVRPSSAAKKPRTCPGTKLALPMPWPSPSCAHRTVGFRQPAAGLQMPRGWSSDSGPVQPFACRYAAKISSTLTLPRLGKPPYLATGSSLDHWIMTA